MKRVLALIVISAAALIAMPTTAEAASRTEVKRLEPQAPFVPCWAGTQYASVTTVWGTMSFDSEITWCGDGSHLTSARRSASHCSATGRYTCGGGFNAQQNQTWYSAHFSLSFRFTGLCMPWGCGLNDVHGIEQDVNASGGYGGSMW